jgi:hypothetical protein
MGFRGRGSNRRFPHGKPWLTVGTPEYNELIHGPLDPENQAERARIRRDWRNGGRYAIMPGWNAPGLRPFAFWLTDVSLADRRRAERACRCEVECTLYLNLAGPAERETIQRRDLLRKDRKAWDRDRRLYPEDHR